MKIEPREGTLDHPAPGKNAKSLLMFGRNDGLQAKAEMTSDPIHEGTAIGAVHPDFVQVLAETAQPLQQHPGSARVRHGGSGDDYCQEQTQGIDQDMAL